MLKGLSDDRRVRLQKGERDETDFYVRFVPVFVGRIDGTADFTDTPCHRKIFIKEMELLYMASGDCKAGDSGLL